MAHGGTVAAPLPPKPRNRRKGLEMGPRHGTWIPPWLVCQRTRSKGENTMHHPSLACTIAACPTVTRRRTLPRLLVLLALVPALGACSSSDGANSVDMGHGDRPENGRVAVDETKLGGTISNGM